MIYNSTALLNSSLLTKHVFVGGDDGKNEEDGKFDGWDVFYGGVDGEKLIEGASDVSSMTVAIPALGDKSTGTEDPDNIENNTKITTTAAMDMIQTNANNCLAFSCLYCAG